MEQRPLGEQYPPEFLRAWVDRSRRTLGVDTLDAARERSGVLPPLTPSQLADLERACDERIRAHVHDRW